MRGPQQQTPLFEAALENNDHVGEQLKLLLRFGRMLGHTNHSGYFLLAFRRFSELRQLFYRHQCALLFVVIGSRVVNDVVVPQGQFHEAGVLQLPFNGIQ